ncbi:MAG: response regulator [Pirellulaceae bacterium]
MRTAEPVTSRARVLIVDESAECREVLRTLLERRGVSTCEASEARQGLTLMREQCPDVVVLDMDSRSADDDVVRREYDRHSRDQHTALVYLGVARRRPDESPPGCAISKPYHYAPLIRTIEQLLSR